VVKSKSMLPSSVARGDATRHFNPQTLDKISNFIDKNLLIIGDFFDKNVNLQSPIVPQTEF
jgi:hypothetical protein